MLTLAGSALAGSALAGNALAGSRVCLQTARVVRVQAVTAKRWSELAEAFRTLAANIQWKVRRTLSFALHEIAAILGQELAEAELVPTFEHFLKDLDEVKVTSTVLTPSRVATASAARMC